ncbi:hypothetical protein ACDY94_03730 [Escherichia coli]
MARKEIDYSVDGDNRDTGKLFRITEMPATEAEWWAIRAGLAMAKNGVEVPDNIADMGMHEMARIGLGMLTKVDPVDAKPLLDELMKCVKIIPDPSNRNIVRSLVDSDIEEVSTRLKLRAEVFKLHVGFSQAAAS